MPAPAAPVIAIAHDAGPHGASPAGITPARRGVWCAGLLAGGMLLAHWAGAQHITLPSRWTLLGALACAVAALLTRAVAARLSLALAVILAGAGWFTARAWDSPPTDIARLLTPDASLIDVTGTVASPPEVVARARGALSEHSWDRGDVTRFLLDARCVSAASGPPIAVTGALWVRIDGAVSTWRTGDAVRIRGLARGLDAPRNPGERDWRTWSRIQGIAGTVHVDGPALAERADIPRSTIDRALWSLRRSIGDARVSARALFQTAGSSEDQSARALLGALVLGAREAGYDDVDRSFRRLGLSHVLAISGLHVTLVAGVLILLVRATGDRPRIEAIALALAVALMVILVPARSPILRAALIVIALRAGRLAGRRWDALNMLGWVMVGVLIWRPSELWNPGFQLSFGIVGALVWLVRPVCDRIMGPPVDPDHRTPAMWAIRGLFEMLIAGVIATLVSAPAIAAHFGSFSPAAPILTILLFPLVFLATILGYAAVGAELTLTGFGAALAPLALDSAHWLLGAVQWLERIPGAWIDIGLVSGAWAIGATLLSLAWLRFGRWRSWPLWCATVAIAAWLAWDTATRGPGSEVALRIDGLDVGDGSCYLVRSTDRSAGAVMFDCGSRWFGIGERTIPDAVRALRAPRVHTVIVSHHDTDHYSGLLDAAESMGVRRVLVTPQFLAGAAEDAHGPGAQTLAGLRRMGIDVATISRGDRVELGPGIALEILWPPPDYVSEQDNNTSVVALARIPTDGGERRVLFTGDIERDAIDRLSALYPNLRADIMEAPHHGSARPFAIDYVTRTDPRIVIQSSGPSRSGDRRWDRARAGRTWLLTADVGAALAEILRDGSLRGRGFRDDLDDRLGLDDDVQLRLE